MTLSKRALAKQALTQERLRELVRYDPDSGHFYRLKKASISSHDFDPAKPAGGIDTQGYWHVRVDSCQYKAHHLAWFYVHGYWPALLDHKDGARSNNRIGNLREATATINAQNVRTSRREGIPLGVQPRPNGTFSARVHIKGRLVQVGTYNTAEEAHAAYVAAKRVLHPGCML